MQHFERKHREKHQRCINHSGSFVLVLLVVLRVVLGVVQGMLLGVILRVVLDDVLEPTRTL